MMSVQPHITTRATTAVEWRREPDWNRMSGCCRARLMLGGGVAAPTWPVRAMPFLGPLDPLIFATSAVLRASYFPT